MKQRFFGFAKAPFLSTALFVAALLATSLATAQNRPSPPKGSADLYVLAVGIGEYSSDFFSNVFSAEMSASMVAHALRARGARHVIVLTSRLTSPRMQGNDKKTGFMVTRKDIRDAIVDLKTRIRQDRAKAPRIVLYIMGHGAGDPDLELLFSLPGDHDKPLTQNDGLALIQSTMVNLDLISSLINFRIHPSMSGWDSLFLPGDAMPDLSDPIGSLPRLIDTGKRIDIAKQRGINGAPAEGNPPVPYMILFDNCSDEIDQNMFVDGKIMQPFMQDSLRKLTNEGLVFYAAVPGSQAFTVDVPNRLPGGADKVKRSSEKMGPLGRRLLEALASRTGPWSLSELMREFDGEYSYYGNAQPKWSPFGHGGNVLPDVKGVEMIPVERKGQKNRIEDWRFGSG